MKRFSFDTFRVNDANRAAFDTCQGTALLAMPPSKRPLVLFGPEGSGKTHLLYAVVNQVRAHSQKTGIAYITATDFPEQVRLLVRDTGPLQRAPSAILLVDHLDRFAERLADLEAVVRAFLEHGHAVIAASAATPENLTRFPQGLRTLFQGADIIPVGPENARARAEALDERLDGESHEVIERQRREIEALRERIVQRQQDGPDASALDAARARLAEIEQECEHLRAENSLFSVAHREGAALREQNETLQERYADALSKLQTRDGRDEEVAALRRELTEARAETERSKTEANGLLSRAEQLLDEVQKSRSRIAEAQEEQKLQIQEIRQIEAVLSGEGFGRLGLDAGDGANADLEARLLALEQDNQRLEADATRLSGLLLSAQTERDEGRAGYAALHTMVGHANAEMDRLREALSALRGDNEALRGQFDGAQEQLAQANAESTAAREESDRLREVMVQARSERESAKDQVRRRCDEIEALRREAMDQQAGANANARELQGRLDAAMARLEENARFGDSLLALEGHLAQASRTVEELRAQRAGLPGGREVATSQVPLPDRAQEKGLTEGDPIYFAGPRASGGPKRNEADRGSAGTGANGPSAGGSFEREAQDPGTDETPRESQALPVSNQVPDETRFSGQISPRLIHRDESAQGIRAYTPRELSHGQFTGRVPRGEPVLHHVEQFEDRLDLLGDESYGPMGRHGVEALHRLIHADDDPSI